MDYYLIGMVITYTFFGLFAWLVRADANGRERLTQAVVEENTRQRQTIAAMNDEMDRHNKQI